MRLYFFLRLHAARAVTRVGANAGTAVALLAASLTLGGYAAFVQRPTLHRLQDALLVKTEELRGSGLTHVGPSALAAVEPHAAAPSPDIAWPLHRCAQQAAVQLTDLVLDRDRWAFSGKQSRGSATMRATVRATGSYAQLKRFQALVLDADPPIELIELTLTRGGGELPHLAGRYTFVRFD